jgi:3-deoxy-D-manno-octulosonic-acid transferase
MNIFQFAYNFLVSGLALVALPVAWCHERRDPQRRAVLAQRLGYHPSKPDSTRSGRPRIWIHAVSVGEVKAAEAVLHVMEKASVKASILLTTTTSTGFRYAEGQFADRATVRYAPLDLWGSVGRFLCTHRPDLLVCMETEIWPNWIVRAHAAGIKIVFLNGRISARSIRPYMLIRPLIRTVLEKVETFSMISRADARRIMRLGAPAHRVQINGNVKMDAPDSDPSAAVIGNFKRLFAVEDHTPVFIAGSVRWAEAEMLLTVYARLAGQVPGLVFIIAPRHTQKSSRFAELAREKGIPWQYRTDLEKTGATRVAPLVILDTMGELRDVYNLATVVFCGASLVPLGGQNVLEAAVSAKPVLFGPFMEDFEEARALLEAVGGGICVQDPAALAARAGALLNDPAEARRLGALAKEAVRVNQGAALRHAGVLTRLLGMPPLNN